MDDVEAQETKLDLNVLFDVANIMATTSWKPFCITVLTDLIVEVNNKKDNNVPLMILDFDGGNLLFLSVFPRNHAPDASADCYLLNLQ